MKHTIILIQLLLYCFKLIAQNELSLNVSTLKTDLRKNAIGFAVEYLNPYSGVEITHANAKGFLSITPEISLDEGTADAFSQMIFKMSGFFLTGKKVALPGIPNPIFDATKTLHIFPIAAGFETSSDFSFVNILAEAGYVPYYQAMTHATAGRFARFTQIGLFVQGGYKSSLDVNSTTETDGGKMDESKEAGDRAILRVKAKLNLDTKNLFTGSTGIGFIGKGTYWFDMLNGASYYQLDVRARLYLAADKFFDFVYQKGSGAPNFNQGDQFGASLSVQF